MALQIDILDESLWPAFRRFAVQTWPTVPHHDTWLRWRFLDAPGHEMRLVMRDGDVVACLGLRRRRWVYGDDVVNAGETYAWFTRPDVRLSGLGIRLMKRVMADVAPIIAAGGSDDTQTLLPRLGWQRVGDVTRFVRPLEGRIVGDAVAQRTGVPAALVTTAFNWGGARLLERRSHRPRAGQIVHRHAATEAEAALYAPRPGVQMMAIPDPEQSRWLGSNLAQGQHVALAFYDGARHVGWAHLRTYTGPDGLACTLNEAWCGQDAASDWRWLVEGVLDTARDLGAVILRTRATHAPLMSALRYHRFQVGQVSPVWLWAGRKVAPPPGIPHIMMDLEDYAQLPFTGH